MNEKLRAALIASDYIDRLHQAELRRRAYHLSEFNAVLEQHAGACKSLAAFHKSVDIRMI